MLDRAQPSRSTFGARPWRGIAAGVALAVTSALTWGSTTLAQDTNTGSAISGPVRIAVFGPMTGLYAATGKQIWTGAKQCGDEINGAGGILGAQLELVQTDDEGDPGKGTLAAQKVADDTSIVATLGWLNSSVAIPTSDMFAPLNLAMISVGATSPVLRAVPETHAMIWRSKRLPVMNRAASKVMIRDRVVLPSWSTRSRR
jgi:ABC-type branched-subunit amino acid transport system substrate-binding protein